MPIQFIALFLIAAVFSIMLHEIAHALVAKWNGDYTAKFHGRITLNPVKHFDLFGFIMLAVVGFGYAKPVPVNPNNFRRRRLGIFLTSVAGILVNLIMAFFFSFLFVIIEKYGGITEIGGGVYYMKGSHFMAQMFGDFFFCFIFININLAIFNLLPIFPLDGHRILESATGPMNKVTKFLRDIGPYILMFLIIIGAVLGLVSRVVERPLPEWLDPLGIMMRHVGGGLRNCFLNFWRLIFGVGRSWVV
jgi:Zn-dependent protease